MIKLNTLIDIFKCLKSNGIISIDDLLLHGLTNKDVNMLVKSGTLKYDNVFYSFGTIEKLYEYGTLLLEKENYKNAKKCFEACILIDSKCSQAYFMLFLLNIKNSAYDKAFLYYDVFCEDIKYRVQARVFIYLLSKLISVPAKYESSLSKDEIMNMESKEEIKYFIESQSCDSVMVAISRFIQNKGTFTLIKEKKYEEVYEYYLDIESYRDLADYETICLDIVEEIVQIFKLGGVLPKSNKVMTNILSVAIGNKDYKRALEINVQFNKSKGINNSTNQINLLLVAINDIIDNIDEVREEIKTNGNEEVETQGLEETQDYNKLVDYLMNERIEDFIAELKNYLTSLNKQEYMFLIMNLVKIDSMLEDNMYSRTMMKLSLIVSGKFSFEISEYVMCFYEYLAMKRFEVASIYLDIIESAKERKITSFSVTGFREIFDKKVNDSGKLFSGVTSSLEVRRRYTFEDLNIQYTLKDLKRSKVLMLDVSVDNEYIREVVSELDNVLCFIINIDGEERMMLKYKEVSEEEGVRLSIG